MIYPTDYNALQQTIRKICNRSDNDTSFNDILPVFIQTAEQKIFYQLSIFPFQKEAINLTLAKGSSFIECPFDYGKTISLAILDGAVKYDLKICSLPLLNKHLNTQKTKQPEVSFENMVLKYSEAIEKTKATLKISFMADKDYKCNLIYYIKPTPMSDTQASNLYLQKVSELLIKLSLIEAWGYLGNIEKKADLKADAQELVTLIASYDQYRMLDKNSFVDKTGLPL